MGTNPPGFRPDTFRAGIRTAMGIGTLNPAPVFHFGTEVSSASPVDAQGVPFDIDAPVTASEPRRAVTVPCAVEYAESAETDTRFGDLAAGRAVLTFLDTDYVKIKGFVRVVLNGLDFHYDHTEVPQYLGEVGVYRVHIDREGMP
jgi:hypothetical protein